MTLYQCWVEVERLRLDLALANSPHLIQRSAFRELTRQSYDLQKAMGWRNIKTKVK